MKRNAKIAVLLLMVLPALAHADRRNYVWTCQSRTIPKRTTELEFYQTTRIKAINLWETRIEVEHGLTDIWDVSASQIFQQPEGGRLLRWDSVQFGTRVRLGEAGRWALDPLLHFEYHRKLDSEQSDKLESRLILAKTVSKWNLALNPVYAHFFAPGTTHEFGLDIGCSWEFHPVLVVGLESSSQITFEEGENEVGSYLGPTVSLVSGEWWYTVGAVLGLTEASDDARVRFLMGIGL